MLKGMENAENWVRLARAIGCFIQELVSRPDESFEDDVLSGMLDVAGMMRGIVSLGGSDLTDRCSAIAELQALWTYVGKTSKKLICSVANDIVRDQGILQRMKDVCENEAVLTEANDKVNEYMEALDDDKFRQGDYVSRLNVLSPICRSIATWNSTLPEGILGEFYVYVQMRVRDAVGELINDTSSDYSKWGPMTEFQQTIAEIGYGYPQEQTVAEAEGKIGKAMSDTEGALRLRKVARACDDIQATVDKSHHHGVDTQDDSQFLAQIAHMDTCATTAHQVGGIFDEDIISISQLSCRV